MSRSEGNELVRNSEATRPLVATLSITPSAQAYFNELRKQHFPAKRNYLDAHITLFNALPDEFRIIEELQKISTDLSVFEVSAQKIMSLGNGTAIKIASPDLDKLHQNLVKNYFEYLTVQDRQKRNFHVTVQNKVDALSAKNLQTELVQRFEPFYFHALGIHLWRYLGGPWEYLNTFGFEDH